jgi:phosphoribosylformylglycinamidine cyclo-ligase
VILGLASSGIHSNGYSLVRRIVDTGIRAGHLDLRAENAELNTTLASALLAPTRIYVKPLLNVMRDFTLHGLVHITGGGFVGNVPRVLPKGVRARIDPTAWPRPGVFGLLQRHGELADDEMLRVFNCGLGMLVIAPREQANDIRERLEALGERCYRVGEIEAKAADEPALVIGALRPAAT